MAKLRTHWQKKVFFSAIPNDNLVNELLFRGDYNFPIAWKYP